MNRVEPKQEKERLPAALNAPPLRLATRDPIVNYKLKLLIELFRDLLGSLEPVPLKLEDGIVLEEEVQRFEAQLIERALSLTQGNQTRAAKLLNTKTSTLHEKVNATACSNANDSFRTAFRNSSAFHKDFSTLVVVACATSPPTICITEGK
jgi:DNA-binding protein Fis